jgi:murein DD-endopeptidase MepM/ murein hydrolase activator NlpD
MRRPPLHLRWIALGAVALLPLAGVVSAISMSSISEDISASVQLVNETIPLDADVGLSPRTPLALVLSERVQRGDSISTILNRMRIEDMDGQRMVLRSALAKSVGTLIPGQVLVAEVGSDGRVIGLSYVGDAVQHRWERTAHNDFKATEIESRLERRTYLRSGTVSSSFFAATDKADVPDQVASAFADVFSDQIDLRRGIRPGDRFTVVYEQALYVGHEVGEPRILSAEFVNSGKVFQALSFRNPLTGRVDYYTPTGRNVKKVFLGSPIEFSRVTSGFSAVRLHPVLQVWRAHKGIDFAAPIGSRVRATADGEVKAIGWQNGYGNTVVIQHSTGFSTLYGHLSGFAGGLRAGDRVSQGEVIGFVGMTGITTGPHLHYEFHVNGVHVDPERFAGQQREDVPNGLRSTFMLVTREPLELLNSLRQVAGGKTSRFE